MGKQPTERRCALCGAAHAQVCCFVADDHHAVCCGCVLHGLNSLYAEERTEPGRAPEVLPWVLGKLVLGADPAAAVRLRAAAKALGLDEAQLTPRQQPWTGPAPARGEPSCALCGSGRRSIRMVGSVGELTPVKVCLWCLVESVGMLGHNGSHPVVALEVLRTCLAELPAQSPTVRALPLLDAAAVLAGGDDVLRQLAWRACELGCADWAVKVFHGFRGSARTERDTLDEALLRAELGERERAGSLLAGIDAARLEPGDRVMWLYARAEALVDSGATLSPAELTGWEREIASVEQQLGPASNELAGYLICVNALLAIAAREPKRAEQLLRSLYRRPPVDDLRLGDLLVVAGDDLGARACFEQALSVTHPESRLAAELRRRLQPAPTPSPLPYR